MGSHNTGTELTGDSGRSRPMILETTLRDGSYAINFQFTAADTALIAGELERAGFELIELGHGIGLGASRQGYGAAAETDEAYLKAAADTLKHAQWGMFCIPGIATLQDVDLAAEHGMSFIRIGTNVTEMEQSEAFIARAKRHGMFVSANLMKSYAIEPRNLAVRARLSQHFGADLLCIVDSAGGMFSEDVERYFRAVRETCDIPLGFHGHNNLNLAVANSIRAAELGAAAIDTSLQGIGRSAGNTPTEIFLLAMKRKGIDMGIDPLQAMDIGEKYIRPLIHRVGYDSVEMISGYAQFHSSYMGIIRDYSSKYRVDPRRLIMAVCEVDKVNAPVATVDRVAREISEQNEEIFTARFRLDRYFGTEQETEASRP